MASETSKKILKEVRPILSLHHSEAKRRVISLYKSWYRQIPHIRNLEPVNNNNNEKLIQSIFSEKLRDRLQRETVQRQVEGGIHQTSNH